MLSINQKPSTIAPFMGYKSVFYLLFFLVINFSNVDKATSFHTHRYKLPSKPDYFRSTMLMSRTEVAPYDDIMPFLSEHINPSDQLLFVGAKSDLSLQLVKNGYGTKKTGFMFVIDSDKDALDRLKKQAEEDPVLEPFLTSNKLRFQAVDLTAMPEVCKQSTIDAIVDYGGLDSVLKGPKGKEGMLKCIDQLQNVVRLGNILICLSNLDSETFCSPFNERFGWVQELDGDPGEISAWYRGKTNIQATKSNFKRHGLFMYVYTNTDNC